VRAYVIGEYGGPEIAAIEDFTEPSAGEAEVVVTVEAASVNPIDWKMREGFLKSVFPLEFPRILGRDFSGTVVAVGEGVREFVPGDAVYGVGSPFKQGTHAERLGIATKLIAPKPAGISHVEAAATGVAALTALAALDRDADLKPGDRVLVHAGAGGVGSYAIQYAKARGAHVVTTASTANADFVRKLGADEVVDYRNQDFVEAVAACDWVLDTVGGDVHVRSQQVLKPGGTLLFVNTGPLPDHEPRADIERVDVKVPAGRADLERLAAVLAAGEMKPVVGTVLPFAKATEAYRLSQSGHARGKVVLEIGG